MPRIDPIARRRGTEPVETVRPVLLTPVERDRERERREAARRKRAAGARTPPPPAGGGIDVKA